MAPTLDQVTACLSHSIYFVTPLGQPGLRTGHLEPATQVSTRGAISLAEASHTKEYINVNIVECHKQQQQKAPGCCERELLEKH